MPAASLWFLILTTLRQRGGHSATRPGDPADAVGQGGIFTAGFLPFEVVLILTAAPVAAGKVQRSDRSSPM